jgi:Fuc2NAc and GlcNAc transferase
MDWYKYLIIPTVVSYFGVILYIRVAISSDIVATPNFRNLHTRPIPVGGGIVFSFVFVFSLFFLWWLNQISDDLFWALAVGGSLTALFGFLDDLKDIRASIKLVAQFFLSGWLLFWVDGGPLLSIDWIPVLVAIPVTALFLIWMINAYNFMDGIDGMAVSGAVFVSGAIALVLLLSNGESEFFSVFILFLASISTFLLFNWSPASIFMGDSGSAFIGYIFGSLILFTVMSGDISIWTWLIVFAYFFADTTVTQLMRIILVKKWYLPHRSHAYQNFARISGSHLKVTGGVVMYNVVWILPLTIWSVMKPEMAIFAVVLAIAPSLVFAFKYGPLLSSS